MAKKIATVAAPVVAAPVVAAPVASVLHYRRDHPKGRASYSAGDGISGLVVVDKRIFAGGKAPKTIIINAELATPQPAKPAAKPVEKAAAATA